MYMAKQHLPIFFWVRNTDLLLPVNSPWHNRGNNSTIRGYYKTESQRWGMKVLIVIFNVVFQHSFEKGCPNFSNDLLAFVWILYSTIYKSHLCLRFFKLSQRKVSTNSNSVPLWEFSTLNISGRVLKQDFSFPVTKVKIELGGD